MPFIILTTLVITDFNKFIPLSEDRDRVSLHRPILSYGTVPTIYLRKNNKVTWILQHSNPYYLPISWTPEGPVLYPIIKSIRSIQLFAFATVLSNSALVNIPELLESKSTCFLVPLLQLARKHGLKQEYQHSQRWINQCCPTTLNLQCRLLQYICGSHKDNFYSHQISKCASREKGETPTVF